MQGRLAAQLASTKQEAALVAEVPPPGRGGQAHTFRPDQTLSRETEMWEMGPKAVTSLLSKGQISQARFEIRGAVNGVWMSALSPSEP